jgi:hypothetical protein
MIRMTRTSILALIVAAACGGGETPPAAPAPAAQPAPAQAQTATTQPPRRVSTGAFEVVDLEVGTSVGAEGKIAAPSTRLPKTTRSTPSSPPGPCVNVPLTARWTYNRQTLLEEKTQTIS